MPQHIGQPTESRDNAARNKPASSAICPIVMACDENFAMPLATALRSLAESNIRHWPLDVTVLTDGISIDTKQRVEASLPADAVRIAWKVITLANYDAFQQKSYLSKMTFARLQIERLFDSNVRRVIYLDADMLILDDIEHLADVSLKGAVVGAVPDYYIDGALRRGVSPRLNGVPKVPRYFNAGVLVIDLDEWRRRQVAQRALEYLVEFPRSPYSDQDALNVACLKSWHELDVRWNFQDHYSIRIDRKSPSGRAAIVHFITAAKPWKPSSVSPNAGAYASYRDRTAFRQNTMEKISALFETFFARVAHRLQRRSSD